MAGTAILNSKRVREGIKRLGLTQAEFAQQIRVREATICDALAGRPIAAETVFLIAHGLGRGK